MVMPNRTFLAPKKRGEPKGEGEVPMSGSILWESALSMKMPLNATPHVPF